MLPHSEIDNQLENMPQKEILEGRGKVSKGEIPKKDKVCSESEEEKYSVGKIIFEMETCFRGWVKGAINTCDAMKIKG